MNSTPTDGVIEDLLRTLAPQVLGAVVRRYGNFDLAEDAVQEALIAASQRWPEQGMPDEPRSWLITVASRRLTDLLRNKQARQRREDNVARWTLPDGWTTPAAEISESDDTLVLLFMCCHPSLSEASQIALTLRAVGGLTTAEIARAFLVPEATMTRRITRAKQQIRDSGISFSLPPIQDRGERLGAVLHTLYLIFNEGYAATSGPTLYRKDLSTEAIRLTRMVHELLPDQRGGDGTPCADGAHRRQAPGSPQKRRRSGADGRAGSVGVERRCHRRGRRPGHQRSLHWADGSLSTPGRYRRSPRRGTQAPRRPIGRRS